MNEHPLATFTDADLQSLLRRAIRITIVFGILAALALWISSGWRNAAMLASGAAISTASIFEWKRIIRIVNSALDKQHLPGGTAVVVFFFLLRLMVFAGVIYVSLKCFQGSVVSLLCGLGLAVLAILWEALRLLRN
jgi:hypothetical protein